MKIAIVYPWYPSRDWPTADGGGDYVRQMAEALAEGGATVHVIASAAPKEESAVSPECFGSSGVSVHRVIQDWGVHGVFRGAVGQLHRMLAEIRPDIINVISPGAGLGNRYFLPSFIGFVYPHAPIATTVFRIVSPSALPNPAAWCAALTLFFKSRKLVFVDEGTQALFRRVLPFFHSRCVFIPCGPNLPVNGTYRPDEAAQHRERLGLPANCRYVCFFGFWTRDKNLGSLIRAVRLVRSHGVPVKLLLIGGSDRRDLSSPQARRVRRVLKVIEECDLSRDVITTGYCDPAKIWNYLFCADVCVFPFSGRVIGRTSLVTALAAGMPIITTRNRHPHFLEHGKNVYLANWRTDRDLAAAIEEVLRDEELRRRIAEGAQLAASRVSWSRVREDWFSLFESLRVQPDQ